MPDEDKTKGDGGTPPPDDKDKQGRTFTQAEVNVIMGKTRDEARERAVKEFPNYDDLKKAAVELSKLKEADLSEQEKLTKRIAELEQDRADWDAQGKARELETNEKLLRAEVRMVAATLNFIKPEQAYKLADLTATTFNDDGEIEGVEKALKELAKNNQHLIQAAGGGGSPPNKPGKVVTKDAELEKAQADARERFGIKDYSKQPGGKE